MNQSIRVVFIDVDDTLLDFGKCAKAAMHAAAQAMSLELPDSIEQTFHRINDALWLEIQAGTLTTEGLYKVRWNRIFEACGTKADGEEFERHFVRLLAEIAEPVDGAVQLLGNLCGRYTLCVASNAPFAQQVKRLEAAGMLPYLQALFISEKLGAAKPQRAFFEACMQAFPTLAPQNMLFLGDSLSADMAGAHACGMQTCWFNKKKTDKTVDFVDYSITALTDCLSFL